jgi:hypothetical protein
MMMRRRMMMVVVVMMMVVVMMTMVMILMVVVVMMLLMMMKTNPKLVLLEPCVHTGGGRAVTEGRGRPFRGPAAGVMLGMGG